MSGWRKIEPVDFVYSPFKLIGKEWMLITAQKDGKVNTMTASWGGLGVIWNKNATFIFVRESRYTKEFIDGSDTFSLTFFDHTRYTKELSYLGTVSGRDEDKIGKSGLTVVNDGETPYFDEGEVVMICRKMNRQPIEPERFLNSEIDRSYYPDKDYHDMYIGEILQIYKK